MKLKKFKKAIKSKYDPVNLIYGYIYARHKTRISNYNKAQINSILFTYSIPNSTQVIQALYKEMIILCDTNEYLKSLYSHQEGNAKLKLFGYIYAANFRPPPNYISLDKFNSDIMFRLLTCKQELIDRYNYYMLKKENDLKNENEDDYDENFINLKHLYDSSEEKKTNEIVLSKKSSSKLKPKLNFRGFRKSKKNVHFSKDHFNLKSYISFIEDESKLESKFESKGVSKYMEPIEIKENEEENENSFDSVMKLMENFKYNIIDNNENIYLNNNNNNNVKKIKNLKNTSINKYKERFNKRGMTGDMLINQNKFISLIKKYRYNFGKQNKYYLSIDKFKEKLKQNNKTKNQIEKYWKINKNFVTNLIENKNIKINNLKNIKNRLLYTNLSSTINYTPESTIQRNYNTNYYNLLSLSPKSIISTITYNTKLSSISPKSQSNIFFKQHNLNLNFNIKRNKNNANSVGNINSRNTLKMKIKNNSDFMRNKNFYCIFNESEKNKLNIANKDKKKKIISSFPFHIFKKRSSDNIRYRRKNSFNDSNKYDYFGSGPLPTGNKF